jgi:hypothetical protein
MPDTNLGAFLNTEFVYEIEQILASNIKPELKDILVKLYQNFNDVCLMVNLKDTGKYPTQEFVNGQLWYPNPANSSQTPVAPVERQVYRKVINFGALPAAGFKSLAHGIPINNGFTVTRIYGAATNPTGLFWIPIPYADSVAVNCLSLYADATDVIVTTGGFDYSVYTTTYIVLEYIKS